MGFLSATAAILGTCAAGFCTKIAADEFSAWAPSWAKRMVTRAARHMPEAERIAAEAEWLAHIEQVPGNVAKIHHAFGIWCSVSTSRISMDLFYRTFDRCAVPFLFVVSIASTTIDFYRGVSWALLEFDIGPAVASTLVMIFYTIGAVRHRRARKRAAAEAVAELVKR